jgi:hypothetical protein
MSSYFGIHDREADDYLPQAGGLRQMDPAQLVTNLIVGAAGAWIAGYLGVQHALQQTKQQRGFDRRLEWSEKAVRTTLKFRLLHEQIAIAASTTDVEMLRRALSVNQDLLANLQQIVDEAMIFAERTTFLKFNRVLQEFATRTHNLPPATPEQLSDFPQQYGSLANLLERACLDLANSIRKQLDLDELGIEDMPHFSLDRLVR